MSKTSSALERVYLCIICFFKKNNTAAGYPAAVFAHSGATVNQPCSGDGDFAVVHAQIKGDGVVVEIKLQTLGDFTEQTFTHELLSQLTQTVQLVYINVKIIRVA